MKGCPRPAGQCKGLRAQRWERLVGCSRRAGWGEVGRRQARNCKEFGFYSEKTGFEQGPGTYRLWGRSGKRETSCEASTVTQAGGVGGVVQSGHSGVHEMSSRVLGAF